jgi:hypothetical protein
VKEIGKRINANEKVNEKDNEKPKKSERMRTKTGNEKDHDT